MSLIYFAFYLSPPTGGSKPQEGGDFYLLVTIVSPLFKSGPEQVLHEYLLNVWTQLWVFRP